MWREDEEEDVRRPSGQERILSFERGGFGSHHVEESFWKRLWTCRQTEYWIIIIIKTVGNGSTAPYILNFGITQKHEANFTPPPLKLREKCLITCLWHSRSVPGRDWTLLKRQKYFGPSLDIRVSGLVALPTEVSWLLIADNLCLKLLFKFVVNLKRYSFVIQPHQQSIPLIWTKTLP